MLMSFETIGKQNKFIITIITIFYENNLNIGTY